METTLFPGSFSLSTRRRISWTSGDSVREIKLWTKVKLACYRQADFFLLFISPLSDSLLCCVTDLRRWRYKSDDIFTECLLWSLPTGLQMEGTAEETGGVWESIDNFFTALRHLNHTVRSTPAPPAAAPPSRCITPIGRAWYPQNKFLL